MFEIEREVGDFYRGWDDDEDQDIQLPPPFDADEGKNSPDTEADQGANGGEGGEGGHLVPRSAPQTSSPPQLDRASEGPRQRHNSMPSPKPSPQPTAFQPAPMARPRRSSSIHEPSPLARLFVRSPDDLGLVDRLRERRMSLVNAVSSSHSQPALSSILSPIQTKNKRFSQQITVPSFGPGSSLPRTRYSHLPRPSIGRIEEGKRLSFSGQNRSPSRSRKSSPGRANVPFPRTGGQFPEDRIAKASDVEQRTAVQHIEEESVPERLANIDERQRRIEKLLEKLVEERGRAGSDVFDDD